MFYVKDDSGDYTFNIQKEKSYSTDNKPPGFKEIQKWKDKFGRWYTMASMRDVWDINVIGRPSKERTGYPTQKPLTLLNRVLKTSLNKGGIVLDPFCGCATTCVAADRLNQNWIGIDISPKAAELVVERIKADQGLFENITHRTDMGEIPKYNTSENKQQLYGQQAGNCKGCGDHFNIYNLEVDHLIAKYVGGTDHIDNLQLLCGNCNRIKGNRGQEYLVSKLSER